MTDHKLSVHVTTQSNLFIGGSPTTFEIGGVDQFTVTDAEGMPYIPASSFKGTLRHIVREMLASYEFSRMIAQAYQQYLERLRDINSLECKKYDIEQERIERMQKRYEKVIQQASAEYLFGIEGFNDTPKLLFNDLLLVDKSVDPAGLFSIDSKNSIETTTEKDVHIVAANPRTYRTVRPGVRFQGEVLFYDFATLGDSSIESCIQRLIKDAMEKFNSGMYRLGNSGSRGYGRVKVQCIEEDSVNG
ncbi:RAMP superfamily CRISPR-associated protein [Paenibacillus polysaccharolyticus]|uniref:RAMP superfamily CRISPR-associated protein n=1 Tax=Paenibacillus polysaccharolyticus TaxID=582692 RepID=UPI0020A1821B|nr:RAMP superfamily CRISPR-associated protein [Paenibacillus polysaccharolyticus]MCP1137381.1 RAMP superfamily CRISPR-associated protein [Paenibacillus polysaccharolyticus]